MKRTTIRYSMMAIALWLAAEAYAQGDELGRLQIADEPTTPRVSAMGSAGTAMPGGGFAIYNPASPAFAAAPFLSLEYGTLPGDDNTGDLSKWKIESAWMFRKWFAGASLAVWSTDFLTATEQGMGGPQSNQMFQATLDGGYTCGRLALGGALNYYQQRIGEVIADQALTFSPGLMFRLIPDKVTLGASFLNYMRLDTTIANFAWFGGAIGLPRYVRAGVTWTDSIRRAAIPFTASCHFAYSEVYKRMMAPLGLEVWILPALAARAGTRINDGSTIVHFGVGIKCDFIACDFDYGLTQPGITAGSSIEPKWLLGLTYILRGNRYQLSGDEVRPLPRRRNQLSIRAL